MDEKGEKNIMVKVVALTVLNKMNHLLSKYKKKGLYC